MKKILLLLILYILASPAFGKAVPVQALENFSSTNPPKNYSVVILEDFELSEHISFKEGDVISGEISEVQSPKRLKRDASFTFVPKLVNSTKIDNIYYANYKTKLDKMQLAQTLALGVGSYFVKGLSIGVSAVEGAVNNDNNNRLKSSIISIYKNSPLSYVEKGQELFIQKDECFFLNFKLKEEETPPNYEYQVLD